MKNTKSTYIIAIIVNIILWYVLHQLENWNLFFITERFSGVLWAFELSLAATIIANTLFMVYDPAWFRHISHIVLNGISIFTTFIIYWVFPFDFGLGIWNQLVRLALLVAMFGMSVAIIVDFFKLILGREEGQPAVSR